MRNYLRYLGYIWRYKTRVLGSIASSILCESLGFVTVVSFFSIVELLFRLHTTGEPGPLANYAILKSRAGQQMLAFFQTWVVSEGRLIAAVMMCGWCFMGLAAIQAVLDFLRRYLLASASLRGWTDMMTTLFDRVSALSMRFFSRQSLGHTMSTFGPDTSQLASGGQALFSHAVSDPFKLLIGLGATFVISWRLALLTYVVIPVALYAFKIIGDKMRRYTRKGLEKRADTMKVLGETLQGATVIKAYSAEPYQRGRFRAAALRMLRYGLRRVMVRAIAKPGTEFIYWFFRVSIVVIGLYMVLQGHLLFSGLLTFVFSAAKLVYEPLGKLRDLNTDIQASCAAADRVFALMDRVPEVVEKPDAVALPPLEGAIRLDHVSFAYDPPNDVIHELDLTIQAGERIAIVGENGSGKSTIVKLLLRFYDPTDGAVTIDGQDLRDVTLSSLRGQIGYMPQEVLLFNDTVRANIAFGLQDATDEQIEAAARAALAHELIVRDLPDGYDTVVGEGGTMLSGGQRQRVALARAMLRNPRVLILDEPTSSMDAEVEHRLHDRLDEFADGRTVILIAHRFAALRRCDRIVALANGRIEHIGTHAELLDASPTYRNLHHKQSDAAHEG